MYSEIEKQTSASTLADNLKSLSGRIPGLLKLDVHLNTSGTPESNFDVMLDTEFEDMAALNAYQEHPEHKEVVNKLAVIRKQRAAIDYEF